MAKEPLKFIVAPHIVQDLGLNLYTTLPRVLVEFVANAYDADSPYARITLNKEEIEKQRRVVKQQWELENAEKQGTDATVTPLAERMLPEGVEIVVEDSGHGMSREDFKDKFLVAGRRRRQEERTDRSVGGRILMGRKGLGKLAGFGVGQVVTIISRAKGESHATRVILDYAELIKKRNTNDIPVLEERLHDGGGIKNHGTIIKLSRLLYEPMKSRLETIAHAVADHFVLIDEADFRIELNGQTIKPTPREYAYGWPNPDKPVAELVDRKYETEDGRTFTFKYRLRFTKDRNALAGKERGVRVYAHNRLAAAPSLLDADTNMHGFRMTDYLDGVVCADFIDDEPGDYIATDRQTLRWESPLLVPMYEILSAEIKQACYNRQKVRDKEIVEKIQQDAFTMEEIRRAGLSKKMKAVALKIAAAIASLHKKRYEDDGYRIQFPQVLRGLGQGRILGELVKLADEEKPDLDRLVIEIARLNAEEIDGFCQFVKGRVNGIKALKKIVEEVDFKAGKNEKVIQKMFEESPWMIDPTYTQFLSADQGMGTLFRRLAKELQIGEFAPADSDTSKKRPDLAFLIGSSSLQRLVVVELKAPNIPLDQEHLDQLTYYMGRAQEWLEQQNHAAINIHGHLIGSKALPGSNAVGAVTLRHNIKNAGPNTSWQVRDFIEVLQDTEAAHDEILAIQ